MVSETLEKLYKPLAIFVIRSFFSANQNSGDLNARTVLRVFTSFPSANPVGATPQDLLVSLVQTAFAGTRRNLFEFLRALKKGQLIGFFFQMSSEL